MPGIGAADGRHGLDEDTPTHPFHLRNRPPARGWRKHREPVPTVL